MDNTNPIQRKDQEFYERKLTKDEIEEWGELFIKHFSVSDNEFNAFRESVLAVDTSFKETNGLLDNLGKKNRIGKGDRRKNKKNFNQHFRK